MSEAQIMAAGDKDKGMVRQANEDDFYISQPGRNVEPAQIQTHGYLYIVADGVGGNRGGDRASEMATTLVPRYYYASHEADIGDKLRQAIGTTAREILNEAGMHPERGNMSCTVAAAVILGNRLTVAHLGDTRVYVLGKSGLQLLTRDHTWVQEQVDAGTLSEADAKRHPNRNVITKSLGSPTLPEPTLHNVRLQEGDRLLLCTDGLSEVVTDGEKAAILKQQPKLGGAVTRLIEVANARGGPDNIAVVTVQYGKGGVVAPVAAKKWLMPLVLLFLAVALFFVWNDSSQRSLRSNSTVAVAGSETLGPEVTTTISPTGTMETSALPPTSTLAVGDQGIASSGTSDETAIPDLSLTEQTTEPGTGATAPDNPGQTPTSFRPQPPTETVTPAPPPTVDVPRIEITTLKCDSKSEFRRNQSIVFTWSWPGVLGKGEYLEVRIWDQSGIPETFGGVFVPDFDGRKWKQVVDISKFATDDSDYRWKVVYMAADQRHVNFESEQGCFTLIKGGGSGSGDSEGGATSEPEPVPTKPGD